MINTRRLIGDDWQLHRDVQLAGLLDAPYSALVTHAEAAQRSEADWRRRLSEAVQFMAFLDDVPVGMGAGARPEGPNAPTLTSMWVAPEARGKGVGDALVLAVLDWARSEHFDRIALWVLDGNDAAEQLYRRHGFARTGQKEAMPRDAALVEVEMMRTLD
ncbi:GNAT family N-acetyltransferase [Nocardia altamirensis]|uniref:GNAT family N-acetyltransferase n=1 Tax=Nocardia altamirensis TaxID=472158 RepID=UPI0008402DF5|nr:GNAT family N-acetyltransferase [Nocardia altamirensis]